MAWLGAFFGALSWVEKCGTFDAFWARVQKFQGYQPREEEPDRYAAVVQRFHETKIMMTVRLKATEVAAK